MYSCTGAAQESWLSGVLSSEKSTFEKNVPEKWSKKGGIENKKFLLMQSVILEECLKLLDQSGGRDSSRGSATDTRTSRLVIQLAAVYRELGRCDQAKSLLNNLLFRLKIKQEHAQDERKYVTVTVPLF